MKQHGTDVLWREEDAAGRKTSCSCLLYCDSTTTGIEATYGDLIDHFVRGGSKYTSISPINSLTSLALSMLKEARKVPIEFSYSNTGQGTGRADQMLSPAVEAA